MIPHIGDPPLPGPAYWWRGVDSAASSDISVTSADRLLVGLRPDEMGDSTTEGCCLLLAFRLDEHPNEGLRPGRANEDPAPSRELALELRHLAREPRRDPRTIDPDVLLRLREQLQHRGRSGKRTAVERLAKS